MIAISDRHRDGRHWHAVFTRSRHEKVAEKLLTDRGLETYLPAVRVLSQWKDRKKWVQKPLFPGYMFARIRADEVQDVLRTRGVVRLVGGVARSPYVVEASEIENLKKLIATRLPLDPYPYLKPGQAVRIKQGALRGVEGVIVKRSNVCYLVVSVEILGQSVCTEVTADFVVPV